MKGGKSKAAAVKKSDTKLAVKKGGGKTKDPNKPKRPPSAFFVFLEGFRQEYKEKNPNNKSVAAVTKAGGERWRSMSDSDKAPYASKQETLKAQYQKKLKAYEKGEAEASKADVEEEESDKSKSEVNSGSEEEEDDD